MIFAKQKQIERIDEMIISKEEQEAYINEHCKKDENGNAYIHLEVIDGKIAATVGGNLGTLLTSIAFGLEHIEEQSEGEVKVDEMLNAIGRAHLIGPLTLLKEQNL